MHPPTPLDLRHATPPFRTFAGDAALESLPRELKRMGTSRALIVCGPSMRRHPLALGRVEAALEGRLAGTFDQVREHSPIPTVKAAAQMIADVGADCLVAVGGGSAIVTSRAASILHAEGPDVRQLCTRREGERMVSPRLGAQKLPQWVVPTTPTTAYAKAGSAVRDPDSGERLALYDPKTRAQGIFLDPELALTAPPDLARSSALNAFAMSVEGLQSKVEDPMADALLLHALRIMAEWLPRLVEQPDDAETRLRLMVAALLSGQGTDFVGGGLAQALSHAAGPRSSVGNGVVEALLLPHTVRYTGEVAPGRLLPVAAALGAPQDESNPVDWATSAIAGILRAVGVPVRLRDVGLTEKALSEVVEHTLEDWFASQVARPAGPEELKEILDRAW